MRIVLVAAEPAFRLGFKTVVEATNEFTLVGDAADARAGFVLIDREHPDVVVMDVALKGMNGIDATREVKRRAPQTRVLLLASWPRERDILDGFAAGANGFALKTDALETLHEALRTLRQGRSYITSESRGLTIEAAARAHRSKTPAVEPFGVLEVLSCREREVLDLVVKGWRNREIARELCISIKTVDTHRTHINRKLRCTSTADLIRFAADNDLLRRAPSDLHPAFEPRDAVPREPLSS